MRIFHLLIVIAVFALTSCHTLPKLHPIASQEKSDLLTKCQSLFLTSKHQLTHSIQATLPDGTTSFLMGILVVSPRSNAFESVIMTIEGLVLFNARYEQEQITIKRGVSYFKSAGFAAGLAHDIKLVFFKPRGGKALLGRTDKGFPTCRFQETDGKIIDLILKDDHQEIHLFDQQSVLMRTVKAFSGDVGHLSGDAQATPLKIQLTAHDPYGYSLVLRLIAAIPIEK